MIATDANPAIPTPQRGDPVWDLARLFPAQGNWTEEEYLALQTGGMVELSDGDLEVLPAATMFHQLIVQYLFGLLDEYVRAKKLGHVFIAPLPVRLKLGTLREPDVCFLKPERITSRMRPPNGADLVMEVVSDGEPNRARDLVVKRREYAEAGVAEYWIIDPAAGSILVLSLPAGGTVYEVHGEFAAGTRAESKLLAGFAVDVSAAFEAGND